MPEPTIAQHGACTIRRQPYASDPAAYPKPAWSHAVAMPLSLSRPSLRRPAGRCGPEFAMIRNAARRQATTCRKYRTDPRDTISARTLFGWLAHILSATQ